MLNIPKQIEYWVRTAEEDFEVGSGLIHAGKTRHGLFFVHLAEEAQHYLGMAEELTQWLKKQL